MSEFAIWKFPLEITGIQWLEMPTERRFLHVGLDPTGTPCLWALVQPSSSRVKQAIIIRGTGHTMEAGEAFFYQHIGTFVHGDFVWHVSAGKARKDEAPE